ncbi:MAG: TspO/MBR family protein [Pseudomonadota bacterium]
MPAWALSANLDCMFWILFAVFLAACIAPIASGALFQPGEWYERLSKPAWTPPDWAFPIVWSVLYVCMSVAAARIALLPETGLALALWSVQITLNTLWSGVFFGLRRMASAGIVVLALWLAVAGTMVAFWVRDPVAGGLMAPYLVWVTLASTLNWTVWARNRMA